MKPASYFTLVCCLLFSGAAFSDEAPSIYTIHIGVNAAPRDSGLPTLRYADDDAVRMFTFFRTFSAESVLAAVLDKESQKTHSELVSRAIQPRQEALDRALDRLAALIEADKRRGRKTVVYLSYSGHGEKTDAGTRLPLLDGFIDRDRLEAIILGLKADVVHLFIDACYGEGVVDSKGLILSEVDATSVTIRDTGKGRPLKRDLLERFPEVGALISSSSDQEAFEWSQLGSGVFTHELLSALSGAADVNGDGSVAYSEAAAFISAANRAVQHEKARLQVVSHPPRIDRNLPIISFSWTDALSFLRLHEGAVGRFFLETDSGHRFLDAHLEPGMSARLIVPPNQRIWLRSGDKAAVFTVAQGQTVTSASLLFRDAPVAPRGGVETALRQGLFATRFGPSYYTGWIDSRDDVGVSFSGPAPGDPRSIAEAEVSRPLAVRIRQSSLWAPSVFDGRRFGAAALFTAAGLSVASTGAFMGFAIHAKRAFDSTSFERPADDARTDCLRYTGLSVGFGVAAAAFGVAGAVMTYRDRRRLSLTPGGVRIALPFGTPADRPPGAVQQ